MPGCSFQVEFAAEKLDAIRIAVVEGFYAVPRGGIEIGGILFGRRDGHVIRVEDYRTVDCEHRTGPSFFLSDKDRAGFAAQLEDAEAEPVGWFHSHTRTEIFLSPEDLEIHDRFFPQAWQVAMVLRPGNMQPLRAGYFFRGADGRTPAAKPCLEFVVEPTAPTVKKRLEPAAVPAETSPVTVPSAAREVPPEAPLALPSFLAAADLETKPKTARKSVAKWLWLVFALVALSLLAAAFVMRSLWMPEPPRPALRLQASDLDGKLLLRWNPARIQDAQTGELTIHDGGKPSVIPLDPVQMARGFYVYSRQSDKTIVNMKAGPLNDMTTFAGPLPQESAKPEDIRKADEEAHLRDDLEKANRENQVLQRRVRELTRQLEEPKP